MTKAIILCAGKSTRTKPLTDEKPKPLLKILNKTLLQHNIEILEKNDIKEIVLVIGYQKDKIKEFLENQKFKIKIKTVEQKEQKGTGHAVLQCEKEFDKKDKILILNGDDIYSENDIKNLLKEKSGALAFKVENPSDFGIFVIKNSKFDDLIEKPVNFIGNLANIGCYLIDYSLFSHLKNTKLSVRQEIELTEAIKAYAKKNIENFKILEIKDYWLPVVYPWSYLESNVFFLKKLLKEKSFIKGKIEKNVVINGNIFLDEGSEIKSGTYIEGPVYIGKNTTIGPNAFLRKDTIIMDNCNFRGEIVDSVVMSNTKAKHNCYIGHSIIGENCNIAAGTITSDYRHDGKSHITLINEKKIDTKRRKLGAFLGDNVCTGIGTLIYPGRKIKSFCCTLPGEILKKDKN